MTDNKSELEEYLAEGIIGRTPNGEPIWDVQFLLAEPKTKIETNPEKVPCCPFLRREVILNLDRFQNFSSFAPIDFTTEGVMLSYKWEDEGRPDTSGKTLHFVKEVLNEDPTIKGCFVDYMCLPQEPRTPAQKSIFKRCLESMNVWYTTHPTICCSLDDRYFTSSWCLCENMLASHSQNLSRVAGAYDSDALILKFLGNQLLQNYEISNEALLKVCENFQYTPLQVDVDFNLGVFTQSVLAGLMLRLASSHATNGSDKEYIMEIMRAFTQVTRLFVSTYNLVWGIIEDVRFEDTLNVIGILEDGSEVKFNENTVNPRDTIMGCTVMRKERTNKNIDYLFE